MWTAALKGSIKPEQDRGSWTVGSRFAANFERSARARSWVAWCYPDACIRRAHGSESCAAARRSAPAKSSRVRRFSDEVDEVRQGFDCGSGHRNDHQDSNLPTSSRPATPRRNGSRSTRRPHHQATRRAQRIEAQIAREISDLIERQHRRSGHRFRYRATRVDFS